MNAAAPAVAGLYGKIPAYGDFLHRDLPSSFVEPWNSWLDQGLRASQTVLKDGWMEAYLTSPPWRFILEPGLAGEEGWLGVMASSVDRVNRCYPITVAIALGQDVRLPLLTEAIDSTLDALEKIILRLIDGSWTPDAVMAGIDALALTIGQSAIPPAVMSHGGAERLMTGPFHASISGLALRWFLEVQQGASEQDPLSGWWHRQWGGRGPESFVTPGLPGPGCFVSLLDGDWSREQWANASGGESPS
jgi:type VI secretion system protein ImpM